MTAANSIADVLFRLGFQGAADIALTTSWVTVTELYAFADEAVQKIAYASSVFVTHDTSVTVSSGTAVYALPASHVFTLAVFLANKNLRLTAARELWALDATWNATSGPATRASMDATEVGSLTLYPIPTVGGTLDLISAEYPATVALSTPTVALPSVFQDWLSYEMLAQAKGKESEAFDAAMADHYSARARLYEQIAEHLYGTGH